MDGEGLRVRHVFRMGRHVFRMGPVAMSSASISTIGRSAASGVLGMVRVSESLVSSVRARGPQMKRKILLGPQMKRKIHVGINA